MGVRRMFLAKIIFLMAPWSLGTFVYCDGNNGNVSLSSHEEFCPAQPVTVQCNVTKPQDGAQFLLSWGCTDPQGIITERLVICNPGSVPELNCLFGKVYGISGDCICNEAVITSKATFNSTSVCDMMLFCSSGGEERQEVSVTINGLYAPVLSEIYNMVEFDNGTYEVTVWWTMGDCSPDDVEYNLRVSNQSSQQVVDNVTIQTQMTHIHLTLGIEYAVTVTAQLCDGTLMSYPSNQLLLYIPAMTPTAPNTTTEEVATERTPTSTGAIIGASVTAVFAAAAATVAILGICYVIRRNAERGSVAIENNLGLNVTEDERGSVVEVAIEDYLGLNVTEDEMGQFLKRKEDVENERCAVGGLYVDSNYIYYSYKLVGENQFFLRICGHDGTLVWNIPSKSYVRGIGKDDEGFLYILRSDNNSQVWKFDHNFVPVRKTCNDTSRHLGQPYAMLVTSNFVLVTSRAKKKICILDKSLNLCRYLSFQDLTPIGIEIFRNKYFFTTESAICVIENRFVEENVNNDRVVESKNGAKMFVVEKYESVKTENGSVENFKSENGIELRAICADDKYLYVTERNENPNSDGGRVLCLDYRKGQLYIQHVYRNSCQECTAPNRCCPIVIAHHDGTIFFNQGRWESKFHLIKCSGLQSVTVFDEM